MEVETTILSEVALAHKDETKRALSHMWGSASNCHIRVSR